MDPIRNAKRSRRLKNLNRKPNELKEGKQEESLGKGSSPPSIPPCEEWESLEIDGCLLVENWLTEEEEKALIKAIDEASWETSMKRRVQQYGYR